jgi:hypothetical protein
MILVDFGNAFWLFAVMKERKHRLVAVMILVGFGGSRIWVSVDFV